MKHPLFVFLLFCVASCAQHSVHAVGFQSASDRNQFVPDEIIVKFKPHVSLSARSQTALSFGAKSIQTFSNVADWSVAKLPAGQTVQQALVAYATDPNVAYAQPNYIYHAMAVPNDPDYGQLWAAKNNGQPINMGTYPSGSPVTGTPGADMNLEAVWNVRTDCSAITVAVLDSGVNYNSTDLAANMWDGSAVGVPLHGWNFVSSVSGGTSDPMDYFGHGTHVAGIIGAVGNNGTGTTGVCWKARIMAVRVLDETGRGSTANIIQGVDFAVTHGAKIINMSLGGNSPFNQAFSDAISRAHSSGVLVVVAAGNESTNNDTTASYPCNFPQANLLCVAALDQNYALANFSNWGANNVHIGAPGTNIRSTYAGIATKITDPLTSGWNLTSSTLTGGWGYYTMSGTSTRWIANPKTFWGSGLYNAGTDDRTYKTFDLSGMAGSDLISLSVSAAINVNNGDYFNGSFKSSGGDPFLGGTNIFATTNMITNNSTVDATFDIKGCASASCSIGGQLLASPTSTRNIGVAITSLSIYSITLNNTSYKTSSGTSMATPEVTGVAALVWAHNPLFTFDRVIHAIYQGGRPLPSLAGKTITGKAVDAMGALSYIAPPTGVSVKVQ